MIAPLGREGAGLRGGIAPRRRAGTGDARWPHQRSRAPHDKICTYRVRRLVRRPHNSSSSIHNPWRALNRRTAARLQRPTPSISVLGILRAPPSLRPAWLLLSYTVFTDPDDGPSVAAPSRHSVGGRSSGGRGTKIKIFLRSNENLGPSPIDRESKVTPVTAIFRVGGEIYETLYENFKIFHFQISTI